MALTDVTIRNAKPAAKAYKLGDSGGLYLFVTPSGGKLWRGNQGENAHCVVRNAPLNE